MSDLPSQAFNPDFLLRDLPPSYTKLLMQIMLQASQREELVGHENRAFGAERPSRLEHGRAEDGLEVGRHDSGRGPVTRVRDKVPAALVLV